MAGECRPRTSINDYSHPVRKVLETTVGFHASVPSTGHDCQRASAGDHRVRSLPYVDHAIVSPAVPPGAGHATSRPRPAWHHRLDQRPCRGSTCRDLVRRDPVGRQHGKRRPYLLPRNRREGQKGGHSRPTSGRGCSTSVATIAAESAERLARSHQLMQHRAVLDYELCSRSPRLPRRISLQACVVIVDPHQRVALLGFRRLAH